MRSETYLVDTLQWLLPPEQLGHNMRTLVPKQMTQRERTLCSVGHRPCEQHPTKSIISFHPLSIYRLSMYALWIPSLLNRGADRRMCVCTLVLIARLAPYTCFTHRCTTTISPDQGLEDIVPLVAALEAACKGISMLVRRAAIAGATGVASGGGQNAGGDEQKKLDVVSNDLLKSFLARSGVVRVLASEEVCTGVCVSSFTRWVGLCCTAKAKHWFCRKTRNFAKKRRLRSLIRNCPEAQAMEHGRIYICPARIYKWIHSEEFWRFSFAGGCVERLLGLSSSRVVTRGAWRVC